MLWALGLSRSIIEHTHTYTYNYLKVDMTC